MRRSSMLATLVGTTLSGNGGSVGSELVSNFGAVSRLVNPATSFCSPESAENLIPGSHNPEFWVGINPPARTPAGNRTWRLTEHRYGAKSSTGAW